MKIPKNYVEVFSHYFKTEQIVLDEKYMSHPYFLNGCVPLTRVEDALE